MFSTLPRHLKHSETKWCVWAWRCVVSMDRVPEAYPLRKHSWNQGQSLGSHGSPFINLTSSTAQGGGGSFKNRKPIGEIGCCESGMAERSHWWTERCLRSPLFLSLSLTIYLPTNLSSMYHLSIYLSLSSNYLSIYLSLSLFHLSICLSVYLSNYLSICLPVYLWCSVIQCNVV